MADNSQKQQQSPVLSVRLPELAFESSSSHSSIEDIEKKNKKMANDLFFDKTPHIVPIMMKLQQQLQSYQETEKDDQEQQRRRP